MPFVYVADLGVAEDHGGDDDGDAVDTLLLIAQEEHFDLLRLVERGLLLRKIKYGLVQHSKWLDLVLGEVQ